jgi:hypothetical protein
MAYNPNNANGQATAANSSPVVIASDQQAIPPHFISGSTLVHKDVEYTTQQTGATLWTPTAGKKFTVTDLTITTAGTTAGLVTLFDTGSAVTAYVANTNTAIFRGNFVPSATSTPGVVKPFTIPYVSQTANNALKVTTSAAMTVYIQVSGYEI